MVTLLRGDGTTEARCGLCGGNLAGHERRPVVAVGDEGEAVEGFALVCPEEAEGYVN